MTITFALLQAFVASFLIGVGVGMMLSGVVRLVRWISSSAD